MTLAAVSAIGFGCTGLPTAAMFAESHPGHVLPVEPNVKDLPPKLAEAELLQMEAAAQVQVCAMLADHRQFERTEFSGGLRVDACENWATATPKFNALNMQRPKADHW